MNEQILVSEKFYHRMRDRRSIRRFSDAPVDQEILLNAIRTAGTAPNGANRQPWFFALIQSQNLKEKIRERAEQVETQFYGGRASRQWLSDLAPLGTGPQKEYLSVAPALIAVFTRSGPGDLRSYYPLESAGIATGMLITALHLAGLGTLTHTPQPMSFLNEVLGLDRSYRPFMLVIAGYPALPIQSPDIQKKSLEEICEIY